MRIILQYLLLLFVIRQTHAQEENNFGHSTHLNLTLTNSTGNTTGKNEITAILSDNTTLPPVANASDPLKEEPTMNPSSMSPTETPLFLEEPYLLIRPLYNIQISLFGTYNSTQEHELRDTLRSILEDSLYRAMVEYFIPESVKEDMDNVFNQTNMTDQDVRDLSILSKVILDWRLTKSHVVLDDPNSTSIVSDPNSTTVISANVTEEPNVHMLLASGALGFKKYDYTLLHPQTILPLQERIISGGGGDGNMTVSFSEIEKALQARGFSLEVLQLFTVEREEEPPTPPPTELTFDDEDEDKKGHDDEDKTPGEDIDGSETNSTSPDDAKPANNNSVSQETIEIALAVAAGASGFAFCLFLIYVRLKSIKLQKDHFARKQRVAKKMETSSSTTSEKLLLDKSGRSMVEAMFSGNTSPTAGNLNDAFDIKSTSQSSVDSVRHLLEAAEEEISSPNTTTFDIEAGGDVGENV